MQKLLFSLTLITFGLIVGQIVKVFSAKKVIKESVPVDKYIRIIRTGALLGLDPIRNIGVFWIIKMINIKFITLPFLGVASIVFGGVLALLASRVLRLKKKQTGSMFVSGAFTNMGVFGGLICFVFFGEISYAFVSMYMLLEQITYYSLGFPIAKSYANNGLKGESKMKFIKILTDPYIIVTLSSIIIGSSLNFIGIIRPEIFTNINNILIPLTSILLVITVGYNMKPKVIGGYLKECFAISIIKFLLLPVIITTCAYLLGLGMIYDGLVLKVILIMSSMPPAITALIPPQIYGLDVDLANSCWLFNTAGLILVLPILYIILNVLSI